MSDAADATTRVCLSGTAAAIDEAVRAGMALSGPAVAAMIVQPVGDAYAADALARARSHANRHDLAFLLADDSDMAALVVADGIEVDWSPEGYEKARRALGAGRTVGCRAGLSRDRAMQAADAGADYVALVAPGPGEDDMDALIEMVEWWSQVIVVPCLAHGARDPAAAARLAGAGADFIAVPADLLSTDPGPWQAMVASLETDRP